MKISVKKKGIVAHQDSEDDEPISYCPRCLEFGFQEVLGNRIYKPDEPYREGDKENWRQCHTCGLLVPVYELKKESIIKDKVDVSDNPFGQGKQILGFGNRNRGKSRLQKRHTRLLKQIDDEPEGDIKNALASGCTVEILSDDSDQLDNRQRLRAIEDLEDY